MQFLFTSNNNTNHNYYDYENIMNNIDARNNKYGKNYNNTHTNTHKISNTYKIKREER